MLLQYRTLSLLNDNTRFKPIFISDFEIYSLIKTEYGSQKVHDKTNHYGSVKYSSVGIWGTVIVGENGLIVTKAGVVVVVVAVAEVVDVVVVVIDVVVDAEVGVELSGDSVVEL